MNRSTDFIPFARPCLGEEEETAVLRVMRGGWLTTATESAAFEREFALAAGAEHAIAVNSATAGLHLALEAVGVGPDDRVAMSPYTFTACAEVVRYLGADPLFVDIDPRTLTICPQALRRALEGAAAEARPVRAIMPVHVAGLRCDMQTITALAAEHGAVVVEDAAHCVPHLAGRRCNSAQGVVSVYSFYATKPITTGEGGMAVTDDAPLADRMRTMRLHGIDRDAWERYRATSPAWQYDVVAAGFKYNLPDLQAAIGRVQLGRARELLLHRARIAATYRRSLADVSSLMLPPDSADHSHHLFIVRIRPRTLSISRDRVIELLARDGIGASVHYRPLHLMSYYRDRYGLKPGDFPLSLEAYEGALSLPLYAGLTQEQIGRVIGSLRAICSQHHRVESR
ncbi:MAG: DegT/DnrJ/EryC1/StrS aminotransferase family protein [Spirochaetaceae bacterium]|nr:MAG: DegT/DnrJ/EryC1/StrS aminotransferase family protein [Spirochaetaceae bacterium]